MRGEPPSLGNMPQAAGSTSTCAAPGAEHPRRGQQSTGSCRPAASQAGASPEPPARCHAARGSGQKARRGQRGCVEQDHDMMTAQGNRRAGRAAQSTHPCRRAWRPAPGCRDVQPSTHPSVCLSVHPPTGTSRGSSPSATQPCRKPFPCWFESF